MSQHDHRMSQFDPEGLVLPRKLPNPVAESREKKDLHREMLWKMKFGSNDPKNCELAKAYAGYANRQRMKALEEEQAKQMTFEKLLEEQRQRLHSVGHQKTSDHDSDHSDLTFDAASSNINSPPSNAPSNALLLKNAEFYEVFSKVRAKVTTSTSNSEPANQSSTFDLVPKAAKAV